MSFKDISYEEAINYMKSATDHVYIFLEKEKDFFKVLEETRRYFSLWEKNLKNCKGGDKNDV